jgi:hypothetical protein
MCMCFIGKVGIRKISCFYSEKFNPDLILCWAHLEESTEK